MNKNVRMYFTSISGDTLLQLQARTTSREGGQPGCSPDSGFHSTDGDPVPKRKIDGWNQNNFFLKCLKDIYYIGLVN